MSLNVIDLIKGQLGSAATSQTASQLGESDSGIQKAISGLLPMVVGGLANHADNPEVVGYIRRASSDNLTANVQNPVDSNSSAGILSLIFGDKISGLTNTIATYAGISNNSSGSLLNMVTSAALGAIGRYSSENNLDGSGISTLLKDQKSAVSTLMPAGLSLASLSDNDWAKGYKFDEGKPTVTAHDEPKAEVTRSTAEGGTFPDRDHKENSSIWKWLLPLLLLIVAGYFIYDRYTKKETTVTTTSVDSTGVVRDTTETVETTTTTTTTKTDENIDLNGTALKGYKGGMEDQMISFLKSDGYNNASEDAALKDQWYNFDHVNFTMGSASQLEAGSEGQLENLAAILKAYPEAKIKIGAYTDKVGNESANKKLSTERAMYVKDWLTKQGVGSQILGAEGYGSEFAEVDASATDSERAADRKMAVRFAK